MAQPGQSHRGDQSDVAGTDDADRPVRRIHRAEGYQSGPIGPPRAASDPPRGRDLGVGCAHAPHAVPDRRARAPLDAPGRRGRGRRGGRRSSSRRRRLPRRRARRRCPDHPRRRDAPPQRLRVGRPRARGADRREPRHRRRRRAASRASAGARRRDVRGRLDPLPDARHARAYAGARELRRRRRYPGRRAIPAPDRRLAAGRCGRPDGPPRRGARQRVRRRDAPLAPRRAPPSRGLGHGLPDPRRRLAVLDRDLLDDVVDHRLRAAPRPAARAARGRRVRPCPAGRPADVPALLRPDAAAQPGRAATARRAGSR